MRGRRRMLVKVRQIIYSSKKFSDSTHLETELWEPLTLLGPEGVLVCKAWLNPLPVLFLFLLMGDYKKSSSKRVTAINIFTSTWKSKDKKGSIQSQNNTITVLSFRFLLDDSCLIWQNSFSWIKKLPLAFLC